MVDYNRAMSQARTEAEEIYRKAKEETRVAIENARLVVREAFKTGATRLIEELGIESFNWKQYTPYFNDGDTCYFSVHSDEPGIDGVDGYDMPYPSTDAQIAVSEFLRGFSEDDLLFMFDDHAQVTVTKYDIVVEEYNHD